MKIPELLKKIFLLHFIIDIIFAIPLILFPEIFLRYLGWIEIDVISARLVGAVLIAIGTTSLIKKESTIESYNTLLTLKIIWSFSALSVLLISIINGAPKILILIFIIFLLFFIIWVYYKRKLSKK